MRVGVRVELVPGGNLKNSKIPLLHPPTSTEGEAQCKPLTGAAILFSLLFRLFFFSRSTTGGGVLGGGSYHPAHLIPSATPVRYQRTAKGITSSAYPMSYTYAPLQTGKLDALPTIRPSGAYQSTVVPFHTTAAPTFAQLQAAAAQTQRPQFASSQPLPYKAAPVAAASTNRAPRPSTQHTTAPLTARGPGTDFSYQLPGYCGHIASGAFRFGKSYGRITSDVLAELPGGRRPNSY